MAVIQLNSKNFEKEVLKAPLPVVVDFYTEWAPPCKALRPIFAQLSEEYAGRLLFGRFDIEKDSDYAIKYGVMSVPMLIIFHKGKAISGRAGVTDKVFLKREIDTALAKIEGKGPRRPPRDSMRF